VEEQLVLRDVDILLRGVDDALCALFEGSFELMYLLAADIVESADA
jgi:hypothetical protein